MAEFGVTQTGFIQKTEGNIRDSLQAKFKARISPFLKFTGRTFVGNLVDIVAQELAKPWEGVTKAYAGFDPDAAVEDQVESLALLNGLPRGGPQQGRVLTACELEAGFSATAGEMIAHVVGQPDNRWVNSAIVETVGSTDTYEILFVSETAGAEFVAPAGTLTVIAGSLSGWLSVDNPGDAVPGTDIEDVEVLRLRREQAIAAAGSTTVTGSQNDIGKVSGVIQAKCFPDTDAHSMRVVIWDGTIPAAVNDDIAQAMLDEGIAGGITMVGTLTGSATDSEGDTHTMRFDRATQVPVYIEVEIDGVASAQEVKDSIIAKQNPFGLGKPANYSRLSAAPLDVSGVDGVNSFTMGLAPSPVGVVNLTADPDEILVIDSDNIEVTFA